MLCARIVSYVPADMQRVLIDFISYRAPTHWIYSTNYWVGISTQQRISGEWIYGILAIFNLTLFS
jgi:hypothetical protein